MVIADLLLKTIDLWCNQWSSVIIISLGGLYIVHVCQYFIRCACTCTIIYKLASVVVGSSLQKLYILLATLYRSVTGYKASSTKNTLLNTGIILMYSWYVY